MGNNEFIGHALSSFVGGKAISVYASNDSNGRFIARIDTVKDHKQASPSVTFESKQALDSFISDMRRIEEKEGSGAAFDKFQRKYF